MSVSKYTLDRFEDGYGVLLKFPEEEEQLLIPQEELDGINVGDLLLAEPGNMGYSFKVLEEETQEIKDEVQALIEKLKNNE